MIAVKTYAVALAVMTSALLSAQDSALAATAAEALAKCRLTVGRPVVQACIQQRLHAVGGMPEQHVTQCREQASPAVKGCFQNAMKDVIMNCRLTVGKPIVQACVRERISSAGAFDTSHFFECRKNAFAPVRACVWRTSEMKL